MQFEWDEHKRKKNIEKHGYDFILSPDILLGDHVLKRGHYGIRGEERWVATGILEGRYASVIYTMRGETIRVISLRRAHNDEKRHHQNVFD